MNNNLDKEQNISTIKKQYEKPDIRIEAYKDIKVEIEIKKLFGLLTEKDMLEIKENEKRKRNDIKVSEELDENIPKMIREVKEEMKLNKDSKTDNKDKVKVLINPKDKAA